MKVTNREPLYRYQRKWRQGVVAQLKQRLGLYCHRCEGPEACQLTDRPFLELVIPDRNHPDLAKFGTNTITIYRHILAGKLPEHHVTLLCPECKYETRYARELGNDDADGGVDPVDSGSPTGV